MSGHTPGPWIYANDPYDDGTPYMRLYAGEDNKPDASDGFSITGIVHPNDAHLIAAAPELLAALKEALCAIVTLDEGALGFADDMMDQVTGEGILYPLRDELIAQIDAAIAKATGVKP